jgi:two-component system, cell cycle response regulator
VLARVVDEVASQGRVFGPLLKIDVDTVPPFEDIVASQPAPDVPPAPERMKVLVIEDDPLIREVLSHWLGEVNGYQLQMAANGREGLELALAFRPQLVITDWLMPEMDGLGFCQTLRASDWGRDIYVLMLTSVESEDDFVRAFDVGVDDFISKPVNVRALDARLKAAWRYVSLREAWQRDQSKLVQAMAELALINRKLEQTALSDELTDLPNRRAGMNVLAQVWSAAQRTSDPLSVLAVDIDHFKSINDRYGHAVGDVVLRAVAATLREHARREDTVVRWGGEEFLVVMPTARSPEAARAAERLRRAVQALQVPVEGRQIGVTISVGVSSTDPATAHVDKLLKDADEALYSAKHGGRNRVVLATHRASH